MKNLILSFTLLWLAMVLLPQQSTGQIYQKEISRTSETLERPITVSLSNGNYYLLNTHISGGIRHMLVSKYSISGILIWRNTYGEHTTIHEKPVSALANNDTLVVLTSIDSSTVNNDERFGIMKIHPTTGAQISYWIYDHTTARNASPVKLIDGFGNANGVYMVLANRLNGGGFNGSFVLSTSKHNGAVLGEITLESGSNYAVYDGAQFNNDELVICGAQSGYNSMIFRLRFTGGLSIPVSVDYNIGGNDVFDRLAVRTGQSEVFVASAYTAGGDEVAIAKLDSSLNRVWMRRLQFNNNQNERANALIYDPANDRVVVSGIKANTDSGFVVSFSEGGNLLWGKKPDLRMSGTGSMKVEFHNGKLLYCGHKDSSYKSQTFFGLEDYDPAPGTCFRNLPLVVPVLTTDANNLAIDTSTDVFTLRKDTTDMPTFAYDNTTLCNACELDINDVTVETGTLPQGTFWGTLSKGGKYFINGTVTVPSGSTLDITGVDVVFEQNGQIIVQNGGTLNANNSVFRTCLSTETWQGIRFDGNATGNINSCVFYSAEFAIFHDGNVTNRSNNLKIVNNQFNNCMVAIRFDDATMAGGSVTGNKFYVDNTVINYTATNPVYFGTNYTGVMLRSSNGEVIISQNEFVYAKSSGQTKAFFGVYSSGTDSKITENTFTNCYRAVDSESGGKVSIENNEMEITRANTNDEYQIRVNGATSDDGLTVANNRLTNYSVDEQSPLAQAAIYCDFSEGVQIHNNSIFGFVNGIHLFEVSISQIYSNHIKQAVANGIYAENCMSTTVKCNEIDMNFNNASGLNSVGIRYHQDNGVYPNLDIRGNCIFNTYDAINLYTPNTGGEQLPEIRNNYMYNYINNGIYNDGFNGNIGNGPASPNAGRNVFISNNSTGGAFDIFSTVPINSIGNYNVVVVNGNVTPTFNNNSHSIASCAHFFAGNNNIRIEAEDKCDTEASVEGTLVEYSGSGERLALNPDHIDNVNKLDDEARLNTWARTAKMLAANPAELDKLEILVKQHEKNSEILQLFVAYKQILKGEHNAAQTTLVATTTTQLVFADIKQMLMLQNKLTQPGYQATSVDKDGIAYYVAHNGFFSTGLRGYVNPWEAGFAYDFEPVKMPKNSAGNQRKLWVNEVALNLYPNPASGDEVSVEISGITNVGAKLVVNDMLGRTVSELPIEFSAGITKLSVSGLQNGIYMLTVKTGDQILKTEKLIINHR